MQQPRDILARTANGQYEQTQAKTNKLCANPAALMLIIDSECSHCDEPHLVVDPVGEHFLLPHSPHRQLLLLALVERVKVRHHLAFRLIVHHAAAACATCSVAVIVAASRVVCNARHSNPLSSFPGCSIPRSKHLGLGVSLL
jgi:hypothetical protein